MCVICNAMPTTKMHKIATNIRKILRIKGLRRTTSDSFGHKYHMKWQAKETKLLFKSKQQNENMLAISFSFFVSFSCRCPFTSRANAKWIGKVKKKLSRVKITNTLKIYQAVNTRAPTKLINVLWMNLFSFSVVRLERNADTTLWVTIEENNMAYCTEPRYFHSWIFPDSYLRVCITGTYSPEHHST